MTEQRRLAAILVADVVGYSKLIGSDEAGTLAQLGALRAEIIEPQIAKHAGRLFKSVGDGFFIEFASAVQAVIDQALVLNPNVAAAWAISGWVNVWLGDATIALEHLERAMRLSPLDLAANATSDLMGRARQLDVADLADVTPIRSML